MSHRVTGSAPFLKWNNFLPIGIRKIHFCSHWNFRIFYLNGKRPLSLLTCLKSCKPPTPSLPPPRPTTTVTFRYQQYIVSRMVTRTDGVSNIIPSLDIILSYRLGTLISFSVSYRKNVAFMRNTNDVHLCRGLDRRGKFNASEQIYPVLQVNTNAFLSYVTCTMERISRDIPSALLSWPTI